MSDGTVWGCHTASHNFIRSLELAAESRSHRVGVTGAAPRAATDEEKLFLHGPSSPVPGRPRIKAHITQQAAENAVGIEVRGGQIAGRSRVIGITD